MKNLKRKHTESPKHDYSPKALPFRMPLNGISDRAVKNHHDKLYTGYVTKKNERENRLEQFGREIVSGATDGVGNATDSALRSLQHGETHVLNGLYLQECYFEIQTRHRHCDTDR